MPKVIGAGFGRTGTMSLKLALERLLATSCYHMSVVVEDRPEHIALWRAAGRGQPPDWAALFEGYGALVDWPVARFYVELLAAFPDAKFVLTVRDPARWYESAAASIYASAVVMRRFPASLLIRFLGQRSKLTAMVDEVVWDHHFDGRFPDREHAIAVFNKHIEDVKKHIPSDQLLVFDVTEGWAPLCEFLGVELPEGPFPRSNETAEFRQRILALKVLSWGFVGLLALVGVGVGAGIWSLF